MRRASYQPHAPGILSIVSLLFLYYFSIVSLLLAVFPRSPPSRTPQSSAVRSYADRRESEDRCLLSRDMDAIDPWIDPQDNSTHRHEANAFAFVIAGDALGVGVESQDPIHQEGIAMVAML